MELLTKYSTCSAAIIFAFICQSLALEPANTRVHNYGYIKSNANTRVPIATVSSHLRAKRQVFYTGSRISSTEAQSLVDKHNIRRRNETSSDMEFMTWNVALAELAQEWADACSWGHGQPPRSPEQLPFPQIGQNLYAYTGQLSLERAMAAWSEEEKVFFNYDTLGCVAGEQCGHYTQVVWSRSNEVGCAHTRCSYLANSRLSQAASYLVCNYGPAGNYQNMKPYKRGPACTDCGNGKGWCDNGLCRNDCFEQGPNCECKIRCHNCATVGTDCSCACAEGFIGTNCKDRCLNTHPYCGANPGWPLSWCTNNDESIASYVNENCPALCGACTEFNQQLHGASESCQVVSPDECFNYPENYCSYNGRLQYQNFACVCQCNAGYKGFFCNEAVTDADIGVILHLDVVSQFSWNSIWGTIRPKLVTDINTYCTGHPDKCCDGAEQEQHGTIDYSLSVGEDYPTPNDGSSPISVLLYSKGTAENICRFKELPAEILYEIIKNMENSLNMTVKSCCGATLNRIEKSVPQEPSDDDGGVPLWGYVLAGVAAFIVLAVLFILAVFFLKCKKSSGNNSYFNKEAGSTDNLGYQKHEEHLRIYENVKI